MRLSLLLAGPFLAFTVSLAPFAFAAGVLPGEATPVQREQAQSHFLRAKDLMSKQKFDDALGELRASQEIVASPNTRLQIARCLLALGKKVAAYVEFGRTAVEAKELLTQDNRYQKAFGAATAERAEIEPQLGFLTMTIENPADGTTVTVSGEPIQRAAWSDPAPAIAGRTSVVLVTPGHAPVERTVTLEPGKKVALAIDAQSGAPTEGSPAGAAATSPSTTSAGPSPMRVGAYVAGGVGALGLATFAVFGAMASSTYNDLNRTCGSGPCPSSKSSEISSGKTQETLANVGLALGAVGAGVGVALFVLSMPRAAPAASAGFVVAPGWAGLRGAW